MAVSLSLQAFQARTESIGLHLTPAAIDKLLSYLDMLARWNGVYNLTAIRDSDQMLVQHLFDSLSILPFLDEASPRRVLDVGSGGGLPGIVIAIARPDWHVTVNDIVQKKSAFQTQVKGQLGLANLAVVNGRVESLQIGADGGFDVITSRAFAELANFFRLSRHLLAPDGRLFAMKGVWPEAEIAALPEDAIVDRVQRLAVPELDAQRHLVMIATRHD